MSRPRVYLAGPIQGLTYDEASLWRETCIGVLDEAGIDGLSPMRNKEMLRRGRTTIETDNYDEGQSFLSPAGVTARDRLDVRRSDIIIMNMIGAVGGNVGSMIELGWADAWNKPVVLVAELDHYTRRHPMADTLTAFKVESIEDAVDLVIGILA